MDQIKIGKFIASCRMEQSMTQATLAEKLSSEDYDFVISLVDRLSDNTEAKGLRIMSEDDLVAELTESIESSDKGNTRSAQEVSVSMREKYVV